MIIHVGDILYWTEKNGIRVNRGTVSEILDDHLTIQLSTKFRFTDESGIVHNAWASKVAYDDKIHSSEDTEYISVDKEVIARNVWNNIQAAELECNDNIKKTEKKLDEYNNQYHEIRKAMRRLNNNMRFSDLKVGDKVYCRKKKGVVFIYEIKKITDIKTIRCESSNITRREYTLQNDSNIVTIRDYGNYSYMIKYKRCRYFTSMEAALKN